MEQFAKFANGVPNESTENNKKVEEQGAPAPNPEPKTPEPPAEPKTGESQESTTSTEPAEEPKTPAEPVELNDELILNYIKENKGKEVSSLDELFQEPEQTADPYEGLAEDVKGFVKYNKETGRGYDDYLSLNRDINKLTPIELAREKAIQATGGKLSTDEVDAYLEKKLGVDLSYPDELDKFDLIELEGYTDDYKKKLEADKEAYAKPAEGSTPDMVTLDNGAQMSKEAYDNFLHQRQEYLNGLKKAGDEITGSTFKVKVDDNGSESSLELNYDYSKDDKHKMVSSATDIDKAFETMFGTEKGYDLKELQVGLFWADPKNREKAISALAHKVRAQVTEELMQQKSNPNFKPNRMPSGTKGSGKTLPVGPSNGHGVKFSIDQFKPN